MDNIVTLKKENERLTDIVDSMDKSARLLVQRDLELRRANTKLQTLDVQKSEFISIAAHQIRTPLSALRWSQQMLLDDDFGTLSDGQRDIVLQSQKSVVRLVNLVNNLLEVERLELQKDKKDNSVIDLNLIVKECVSELTSQATERGLLISTQLATQPAVLLAHAESIKDVVLNLLDNAIKYTLAKGTVTIKVAVAEKVTLTITDTGIGIPTAHQANIFKRFSRAENAKKIDADGSGLGLYIIKKLVESYDGSVQFVSTEGVGSTFALEFNYHSCNT